MNILKFEEYLEKINEGLIKTYDIDLTIFHISNEIKSFNLDYDIDKLPNNTFRITIKNFHRIHNDQVEDILLYIIHRICNPFGWFPSSMCLVNLSLQPMNLKFNLDKLLSAKLNLDNISITFESKFDLVVDIPKKLYHLSIKQYEYKILRYGLCPKEKSKLSNHDGRIYVCSSINDCKTLINRMKFYYQEELYNQSIYNKNVHKKDIKWVIYEIDSINVTKLYQDPNYVNGYYLLDNISPENIRIIEQQV